MVNYKHNANLTPVARSLRKSMTKEEKHLWYDFLRNYPVKFTRQKVIGQFVADFYCGKAKLVIELDGSQHFSEMQISKDTARTEKIEQYGIVVVRFDNLSVLRNFQGVCLYIDKMVSERIQSLHR